MTTEEAKDAFSVIIKQKLNERFKDDFVFDPILVKIRLDQDGDPYLHTYIVFEGNQKKLDPAWTAALPRHLWSFARELGFPSLPIQAFVAKSEWPSLRKVL